MEWESILVREAEKRLGSPTAPRNGLTAEQILTTHHQDLQVIWPLAWLYAAPENEFPNNPWHAHPTLLAAVESLFKKALSAPIGRRMWYPLFHALRVLTPALSTRAAAYRDGLRAAFLDQMLPELRKRERLTVLSSANVGYGTNHLAVEVSALTAYLTAFRDDPLFPTAEFGGPALRADAERWLQRFFTYMHPDGFWPECDGPADSYNTLTASALLRAAIDLDLVDRYRPQFAAAARYGALSLFPDGCGIDISNGRTHFNFELGSAVRKCYAAMAPEGKILRDRAMDAFAKKIVGSDPTNGEMLVECLCNIRFRRFDDPAPARSIWAPENLTLSLSAGFHYHKRGPWVSAASTFFSMPRPEGHWNLDYQNLMTLYHDRFGVILYGANGKSDLPTATFHKIFSNSDSMVVREKDSLRKFLPGQGTCQLRPDGWRLWRDYRGFEGILQLTVRSDREVELNIQVNARTDEYPITCTLLPAMVPGQSFQDGAGRKLTLGPDPMQLSGADLAGALVLTAGNAPVRIDLPGDAELRFPYAMWDPYNLKTDRYEKWQDQNALLDIPVGLAGATLRFTVG